MISLQESQPDDPTATIHQYVSRGILRYKDTSIDKLVKSFCEHVAQPSCDRVTQSRRGLPWTPKAKAREPSASDDEEMDQLVNMFQSNLTSQGNEATPTSGSDVFTSPTTSASTSSFRTLFSRARGVGHGRTAGEVLDFGRVAEEAFSGLDVSEATVLKVKIISLVADETLWAAMFQEVGLSRDAAGLVSVILQNTSFA
jgi:hypothetical protein